MNVKALFMAFIFAFSFSFNVTEAMEARSSTQDYIDKLQKLTKLMKEKTLTSMYKSNTMVQEYDRLVSEQKIKKDHGYERIREKEKEETSKRWNARNMAQSHNYQDFLDHEQSEIDQLWSTSQLSYVNQENQEHLTMILELMKSIRDFKPGILQLFYEYNDFKPKGDLVQVCIKFLKDVEKLRTLFVSLFVPVDLIRQSLQSHPGVQLDKHDRRAVQTTFWKYFLSSDALLQKTIQALLRTVQSIQSKTQENQEKQTETQKLANTMVNKAVAAAKDALREFRHELRKFDCKEFNDTMLLPYAVVSFMQYVTVFLKFLAFLFFYSIVWLGLYVFLCTPSMLENFVAYRLYQHLRLFTAPNDLQSSEKPEKTQTNPTPSIFPLRFDFGEHSLPTEAIFIIVGCVFSGFYQAVGIPCHVIFIVGGFIVLYGIPKWLQEKWVFLIPVTYKDNRNTSSVKHIRPKILVPLFHSTLILLVGLFQFRFQNAKIVWDFISAISQAPFMVIFGVQQVFIGCQNFVRSPKRSAQKLGSCIEDAYSKVINFVCSLPTIILATLFLFWSLALFVLLACGVYEYYITFTGSLNKDDFFFTVLVFVINALAFAIITPFSRRELSFPPGTWKARNSEMAWLRKRATSDLKIS